jgi:hypothetical protein
MSPAINLITVRAMLMISVLALASGCISIGVETIGPGKAEVYQMHANNVSVWRDNVFYNFEINGPEGGSAETNRTVRLDSASTNDITNILGAPSEKGTNFIRYQTGKWAWHGVAIDLAIFPIPLTIPLIVPGGKTGYVDFVFDKGGTRLVRYGTLSKFYGYAADDKESGFYNGTKPGFWFNPNP